MRSNSQSECARAKPSKRLLARFLLVLLAGLISPCLTLGQSEVSQEYQVKAAFLYNFAKFVDWPSAAFANDKAPITVCIYGKDPFGATLDDTVRSKTIGARGFAVRRPKSPKDLATCHIAYLGDSVGDQLRDVLSILETSSVLSVGEDPHFADQGGDIQFVMEDGKIRFLINVDSVNRAGFKMSSKLLALAKVVHDPR